MKRFTVFLIGFVGTLFGESAKLMQAERRLVANPDDERALYNVGVLAFREGDIQKASDAFSCLKPRCENGHIECARAEHVFYNAGNAEMKLEKYAEAEKSFEAVLRYNPNNGHAREKRDLARLLQQQKQQQKQQQEQPREEQNQQQKTEKQQQEQQSSQDQKEQQPQAKQEQQKEQQESSQKSEQNTKENKGQKQKGEQQKEEEGTAAHLGSDREQNEKKFTTADKQFLCKIDQLDRQGNQELTRYQVECMKGQDARYNW